ncbi:MAG: M56 family metallopeptidase [Lachnospiraceae bacterium]|nr:M56 family metallopeptidase [Lachnospiraceae bacterium]
MVWTTSLLNNIVIIMLLTSLSGGLLVVIWLGIGAILEKLGFINIVYELLKMVIAFFFLPISYLGLKLFGRKLGHGFLFAPISAEWKELVLILGIWAFVVVLALGALGYEIYRMNRYFRSAFTAKKEARELLAEICEELKIPVHKVELKSSYRTQIPCVTGVWRAKVILPVEEFEEETLRVILTHELTHFKQKDLLLKRISLMVLILHFFNPLAWLLFEKIQVWSEYACDYRSYPHCGGIKHYFEVLMGFASENKGRVSFSSQLYEDRHELVERVKKLSKVSKIKKRAKLSVVLVMCVAFMGSSISVGAATMQTAKAYEHLYRAAESATSAEFDEAVSSEYVLYTESGETLGITLIEDATVTVTRALYNIVWDVPARSRVSAPYFSLTEGQSVVVTASMLPADIEVKVGLESANGTRRYVLAADWASYSFPIEEDGSYRVYIQNDSYTDVSVEGSYIIK